MMTTYNLLKRLPTASEEEPLSKFKKTDGTYEIFWNDLLSQNKSNLDNLNGLKAWHKITFTPTDDGYTFEDFFEQLLACNIFPVCFEQKNNTRTFYVNSNGLNAIWRKSVGVNKATKIAMRVETPFDPDLNTNALLIKVIRQRYHGPTSTLNLSDFENDPELYGVIYLPLSNVYCQERLFFWMKDTMALNTVENINLSRNKIRELSKAFRAEKYMNLDLSSNMISSLETIKQLYTSKIIELNLNNNPLCALFEDGWSYLKEIKEIIPTIRKLDGRRIIEWNKIVYCSHPCFTINEEAHHIVDLFLSTFFIIYDSSNRESLLEYYGESSLFSVTSDFDAASLLKSGIKNSELMQYKNLHRNILTLSDMSNYHRKGYKGAKKIVQIFERLPPTDHDPLSFSVDVIQHEDSVTTVVVMGVFRHNQDAIFRFARTFVLKTINFYKFRITNELLHISCATEVDRVTCFQQPLRKKGELNLIDPSDEEEEKLICVFGHLSGLLRLYSRRRLVESKWDLKEALRCYVEDLKRDEVPDKCYKTTLQL